MKSVIAVALTAAAAGNLVAEDAFQRWAIISSPAAQATGVPDMLAVELSRGGQVQLVERDQVEAALRELALSEIIADNGVAARSKLGRLVRADALAILDIKSSVPDQQSGPGLRPGMPAAAPDGGSRTQAIRLIIADCSQGARLRLADVEFDPDQSLGAAFNISKLILDVKTHYPRGVKRVVGVSPFLCRNLTHEYDYLQNVFGQAVAWRVALQLGTAVIEVQEAQAIRQESEITAGGEVNRLVPAFVEGDYEVAETDGSPSVRLDVRVLTAEGPPKHLQLQAASPAEAVELLMGQASTLLHEEYAVDDATISRTRQAELLRQRADSFARLGAYEQAAGLREAALLLDASDPQQRATVIHEYNSWMLSLSSSQRGKPAPQDETRRLAQAGLMVSLVLRSCTHLEFLIVNRHVNHVSAMNLTEQTFPRYLVTPTTPELQAVLGRAEARKREFIRQTYPAILSLEPLNKSQWEAVLVRMAICAYDQPFREAAHDYAFLGDLLETELPEDLAPGLGALIISACTHAINPWTTDDNTPGLGLFRRLAKSKHRRNAFYGKVGQLLVQHTRAQMRHKDVPGQTLLELEQLEREYADLLESGKVSNDAIVVFRKRIEYQEQRRLAATAPAPKRTPPPGFYDRRLTFRQIPVQIRIPAHLREAAADRHRNSTDPMRVYSCGQVMDVFWKDGLLALDRGPGIFEAIEFDPDAEFTDLAWDGKHAWLATVKKGVWVISPKGEIVARIGSEEGLPSAARGIRVCALE